MRLLMMTIVMLAGQMTLAASAPGGGGGGHSDAPAPAFSNDTKWAGAVVIGIAAMFIAAAVIGPVYRASMPEEPPVAHHDDHGHDDAHGHGDQGHGGHH